MPQEILTARYLASNPVEPETAILPAPKRGSWNRYLTAICFLFAISSIIGALGAASGFYGLSQADEPIVARTADERRMQKIEVAQREAVHKYFPLLVYHEIVKLVLAGALIFAAVYLLSQKPNARRFAIGVCGIALFFHVSSLIVSILMISETGGAVNSMLAETIARMQFQDAGQKEAALEYTRNTLISGITIAVALAFLAKLIYYGVIIAYLWSDDVKKIFGEDPLAYMEKQTVRPASRSGVPQSG